MKIIEVPVYQEDGSVKFTQMVTPEEAQVLLQFALNFLVSTGLHTRFMAESQEEAATPEESKAGLND